MSRLTAIRPAVRPVIEPRAETPVRRPPASPFWRWGLRGAVGVITAGAIGGILWAFASGWVAATTAAAIERMLAWSAEAGLGVRDVLVIGRERTPRADLLKALEVGSGTPILAFDPQRARDAVAALPWVRHAVVERRFPDTIFLRLEERRPLALWQSNRTLRVIDADGLVLTEEGLDAFATLPLVVGSDAPSHAAPLLEKLAAQPAIARRVEAAILVGGRRWDLRLDNGVNVRLPEDGVAEALVRLSELEATSGLFDRDIVAIDLRLDDRLVVQTTPRASERRRMPEEDT